MWSDYSFGVGLTLGAVIPGIIFLVARMDARARRARDHWPTYGKWKGSGEINSWELREPGASDIGSRLPLDRRG